MWRRYAVTQYVSRENGDIKSYLLVFGSKSLDSGPKAWSPCVSIFQTEKKNWLLINRNFFDPGNTGDHAK